MRLVGLVGLVLGEEVAELVDAALVEGLERLKNKGCLGIPLLLGRVELGRGRVQLLRIGLASFLA